MYVVMMALALLLPNSGYSEETKTSLDDAKDSIRSNTSHLQSASFTYQMTVFRPKENILALPDSNGDGSPTDFIQADNDTNLGGTGWIKWDGDHVIGGLDRMALGYKKYGALRIENSCINEAFGPNGYSYYIKRVLLPENNIPSAIPLSHNGEIIEEQGLTSGEPTFHTTLLFREIALFHPLLESKVYDILNSFGKIASDDGNLLVLTNSNNWKLTLDRSRSCMPIRLEMGKPDGSGRSTQVTYIQKDSIWLPHAMQEEVRGKHGLRYKIDLKVASFEINKDYPDSDFSFEFPQGTQVSESTLQPAGILEN